MDVFQEEITFQKMGQASQADIFFDVGGDKSGIFVGNRAEDRDGKLLNHADKAERVRGRTKRSGAFYAG